MPYPKPEPLPPVYRSLAAYKDIVGQEKPSSVFVVTSEELVGPLGWAIKEMNVPEDHVIRIPNGEAAKTWDELEKLLIAFRTRGVDRDSLIVALGGGTVGDPAGFAASIYVRGIRYLQVPTTLLSQADSSHGGKTGIDFMGAKNQIGSGQEPVAVITDPRFIETLPEATIVDGLGEIMKAGLIKDPSILSLIKSQPLQALPRSSELQEALQKGIAAKRSICEADPEETGVRHLLNFGHTVGHALELPYGLAHGRAVIYGMLAELRAGEKMGHSDPSVRAALEEVLTHLGVPLTTDMVPDKNLMRHDKKITGGNLKLPIVRRLGEGDIITVPVEDFINSL